MAAAYGVVFSLEPAKRRVPSDILTFRAFKFVLPSRALVPEIVTKEPQAIIR